MRIIFLLILLVASVARAQVTYFTEDSAAVKLIDSLPSEEPFDTARKWNKAESPFIYLGSENDVYNVFGYAAAGHYRGFDFNRFHVLGKRVCRQCEMYCKHSAGQTACHRNRCQYSWVWAVRDNQKAFSSLFSTTKSGFDESITGQKKLHTYRDTVMTDPGDRAVSAWFTYAQGDCMASFTFGLFKDRYYPVLLLKEWNQYGGCRAARFDEYTILFRKTEGINYYIKQVKLVSQERKEE